MAEDNDQKKPSQWKWPTGHPITRRDFQFSLAKTFIATGIVGGVLACMKYNTDRNTRDGIGHLHADGEGYVLKLHAFEGPSRARHIYVSDDGISVNTENDTWVRYDMEPGSRHLRISYPLMNELEATLRDCSIPSVQLEEQGIYKGSGGYISPLSVKDRKPTSVHLDDNVRTTVTISAGMRTPSGYVSWGEVKNASRALITQTRHAITREALVNAIHWREDEAAGKDPSLRGSKRHSLGYADFTDYVRHTSVKVKSDPVSLRLSPSHHDLTLISTDGREKLNVKDFFAEEKKKYLDSGKSAAELKALLERHEKAAAKINPAGGRERFQ